MVAHAVLIGEGKVEEIEYTYLVLVLLEIWTTVMFFGLYNLHCQKGK